MRSWIEQVLQPYIQQQAHGVPVTLFLDGFATHKSESTRAALTAIGVNVVFIPAGCTSVLQPVDVGIGKPFKDRICLQW